MMAITLLRLTIVYIFYLLSQEGGVLDLGSKGVGDAAMGVGERAKCG